MAFDIKDAVNRVERAKPQRTYLWRVILPDLQHHIEVLKSENNEYTPPIDIKLGYEVPDYNEISTRIHNLSVPFFSVQTEKSKVGNTYWYWANKNDIGNITMDVYEYEDGGTYKYFNAWSKLIFAPNNTNYPPVVYKHKIKVYRLNTLKQDLTEDTYYGYFITDISDLTSDYTSSEIMSYNIKFSGDSYSRTNYNLERMTDLEAKILSQNLNIDTKVSGLGKDDIAQVVRDSIKNVISG